MSCFKGIMKMMSFFRGAKKDDEYSFPGAKQRVECWETPNCRQDGISFVLQFATNDLNKQSIMCSGGYSIPLSQRHEVFGYSLEDRAYELRIGDLSKDELTGTLKYGLQVWHRAADRLDSHQVESINYLRDTPKLINFSEHVLNVRIISRIGYGDIKTSCFPVDITAMLAGTRYFLKGYDCGVDLYLTFEQCPV